MSTKELGHIGDGIYVAHDRGMYTIAVNHHLNVVAFLEPQVLVNLFTTVMKDSEHMKRLITAAVK
jgi:hypothetical protein